ncbi:MAG: Ig-like domain-containing protein, partial [Vicinamibacteria bacterium]|nr:Ig-like domain-containing protein [Vicinamibacteria bacterium]
MVARRSLKVAFSITSALYVYVIAPQAQAAMRSLGEIEIPLYGLEAGVDPANPIVPKQTASGLRIVVRAGGEALSSSEVARLLGGPFQVQADLSGPGLLGALSLPLSGPDAIPSADPLILTFPGLPHAGDYEISNIRLTRAGRALLDVKPRRVTLRVIDRILITSVATRPLTLDEIRDRGVVLDSSAYLGFEFAIVLQLESTPITFRFPVVFNRQGVQVPIPLASPPEPLRSVVSAPQLVPLLMRPVAEYGPDGVLPPMYLGGDFGDGVKIPSLLVIPGSVGYLKQYFSAQLLVGNGAPEGSGLSVRDVTGTIMLPPGLDGVSGTEDDPLALPDLESGPQQATVAVVGEDGSGLLLPGKFGRAELTLRGDLEGRHDVDFSISARLDGLPTGSVVLEGTAHGAVLVRNAYFDVTFTVPTVVRADEEFSLFATVTNVGQGAGQDVKMTLDSARLSGARLLSDGTQVIERIDPGDSQTLEYRFVSQVTGEVVASYLRFDTNGGVDVTGRLSFTLGVGERGEALSPDTLVLPEAVRALPSNVVRAAMRVLGQAWSAARANTLPVGVERPSTEAVFRKGLAVAEAGLRVELGQPVADALRDLLLDVHGGLYDAGFDQVLRETSAGRDFDRILAIALEDAASANALDYEEDNARIAASGAPFISFAVENQGAGAWPADVSLLDGADRRTDLAARGVPTATLVVLGSESSAPRMGWVSSLDQPPYAIQIDGKSEEVLGLAFAVPGEDGDVRHARLSGIAVHAGGRYRVIYDPARGGDVDLETDDDGDGLYERREPVAASLLSTQGPRLVSAASIGRETLNGANTFGVHAALLFDRVVSDSDAALVENYEIAKNSVVAARRQLSGRLVFVALEQPEGPLVPASIAVRGIRDERGNGGARQEQPLGSRLVVPGAVVRGRVLKADGTPVADAVVTYANRESGACATEEMGVAAQRTDGGGRFEFRYVTQDSCGAPFRLLTHDPDTGALRTAQAYVRENGQRLVLDLVLVGHGDVTGTVRHADGRAAAGARVRVVSVTDSQIGAVTTADDQGVYSVQEMTVGAVTVTAVLGPNLGRGAGRLDVAGGTTTVDVTLDGNVDFTGVVRKLEDGVLTPVPGVDVVYYRENKPLGLSVTDSYGQYWLLGVPAGSYRLETGLNQRDKASATGQSVAGQKLVQDLVIPILDYSNYGTVRGTVTRQNGSPAADAWVSDNVVSTRADELGRYELAGVALSASPRKIEAVSPDGWRFGSASVVLTVPGQVVEGADIALSGVGDAVFQVVGPDGDPIAGANVGLQGNCMHACGCWFKQSDAQGLVRFDGLPFGSVSARAVAQDPSGRWDAATSSVVVASEDSASGAVIRMSGFGTVTGRVLNPNGAPAHGASVQLKALHFVNVPGVCGMKNELLDAALTDQDGRFQFDGVHVGGVSVSASSTIFPSLVDGWGKISANGGSAHIEVTLKDTIAGILSGVIMLPDGSPGVPDIEVTASGPVPDVTVHTVAEGQYSFAPVLPAGRYLLTARDTRPAGTGSVAQTCVYLQPSQPARHDLRLKARGPVRVTVVDGDGALVENAVVQVRISENEFPYRSYEGTINSGADQPLAFPEVFEGGFSVDASDNFGRGGRASATVPPDGRTVDVKVKLTTTGNVDGRFLWSDGVTPLPMGVVRLSSGGLVIGQKATASEGEIGSYAFDYVPAGPVRLDAEDARSGRTGVANGALESEGQVLNLDVVAYAVGRVEGDVTLNGSPAPGTEVTLKSGWYSVKVTADGEGRYAVEGVPEGVIHASADIGKRFLAGSAQGTLAGEGQTLDLPIALRGAAAIEGRLLAADGQSAGAVSIITLDAYASHQTTTTDDQGYFRFDLVPEGSVSLTADALASIDCARQTLVVTGGRTIPVDLVLLGVGALEGTAASSAGPVGGRVVVYGTGPGCVNKQWYLAIGPNGQYRIPELLSGPVNAKFKTSAPGGPQLSASADGVVAPGETTVLNLLVEPSGGVQGLVEHEDGQLAMGAQVRIDASGGRFAVEQTGTDGTFLAEGIPVGPITIRVSHAANNGVALVAGLVVSENSTLDAGTIQLIETPLAMTSVTPADGASDVAVTQAVALTFNTALVNAGGFSVKAGASSIGFFATLSSDARVVTLTPAGGWPDSSELIIEAGVWVIDVYGRRLPSRVQSRFRTVDLSPPKVLAISPAGGAIEVEPKAAVTVRFDEPLLTSGDLQSIVSLASDAGPVSGVVASTAPDVLVFTPSEPLASNLAFMATVNGSTDLLGHVQTAAFNSTFMTADTAAPVLQLSSPPPGGWANARPTITVVVSDGLAGPDISRAEMRLDGLPVSVIRSGAQFSHTPGYDLSEGQHAVTAFAHDRAGNRGDLSASFRVDTQAPSSAIVTAPASDQVLIGVVSLSGSASDADSGVARLNFLLDGKWIADASSAGGFSTTWSTSRASEGEHFITARAVDVAGNSGTESAPVRVVVNNAALAVSITSPQEGSPAFTHVTVAASPSEPVARVEFRAGSGPVVIDETAPYETVLDLTSLPEGDIELSVTAVGLAPETATSSRMIVVDRTPPAPPDPTKVSAEARNGSALVVGRSGSVESESLVTATNPSRNVSNSRASFVDGSFALRVAGDAGEGLAVVATDKVGHTSDPLALTISEAHEDETAVPLEGLGLWVRAGEGVVKDEADYVSRWTDQSGQGNHLTQTAPDRQPVLTRDPVSGMDVLRFDGTNDALKFTTRFDGTIRAVFAVLKKSGSGSWRWLLGDRSSTDFHPGWETLWGSYTSASILDGQTWLNGAAVDGTTAKRPATMSVLSVLTTAGVTAEYLFAHAAASYPWNGDIAELIIYTEPLSDAQRKSVEDYLALKYAAYVATAGAPEFTPNGGMFEDSVAVSLSSPTPGAEIRYTLVGSEPSETSELYAGPLSITQTTTVKARAFRAGTNPSPVSMASFTKQSDFSPASLAGLGLWVRSDVGVVADGARRVSMWTDLSGQENHLTQPTILAQPVCEADAVNGLPVLRFDGTNDTLKFTTRFDGTIRAVYAVLKQSGSGTWRWLLGDRSSTDFHPGWDKLWISSYTSAS